MDLNPLTRFTDRVEEYVRYRPSYPAKLIEFLRAGAGLGPGLSAPQRDHPQHEPMIAALRRLYDAMQQGGFVRMNYETELFLGPL